MDANTSTFTKVLFIFLLLRRTVGEELRVIWEEEFGELDYSQWIPQVTAFRGGNQEFQYYRNSTNNSYVSEGVLTIQPTLTSDEYGEDFLYNGVLSDPNCNMEPCISAAGEDIVLPILSAQLRSKFSFVYGRLQIRAKIPSGDWTWPAIWLMPEESEYGTWPSSGEIDMMESRGNRNYFDQFNQSQGCDRVSSTLHFGPSPAQDSYMNTHYEKTIGATGRCYSDDFHLFELNWTNTSISYSVDGEVIGSVSPPGGGFWQIGGFDNSSGNIWQNGTRMAPFDKKFFIILNVAVGGYYFPDTWRNYPHPVPWNWSSPHPLRDFWENKDWWLPTWEQHRAAMEIDYIRLYSS